MEFEEEKFTKGTTKFKQMISSKLELWLRNANDEQVSLEIVWGKEGP